MRSQLISLLVLAVTLTVAGTTQAQHRPYGHHPGHYPGHHPNVRYRQYDRHHDHDAAKVIVGAALLGTLVYAINKQNRQPAVAQAGSPYPNAPAAPPMPDTWFRVDRNGECIHVHLNRDGDEVWTPVESDYCE